MRQTVGPEYVSVAKDLQQITEKKELIEDSCKDVKKITWYKTDPSSD